MDNILDRVPPQNIEAEGATLGAMLLERDAIVKANEILNADDFYLEKNRVLFRGISELSGKNQPVDPLILSEWLEERDLLELVGGRLYIVTCMEQCVTTAAVKHYAEIVKEKALRRSLITQFDDLIHRCYMDSHEIDAIAGQAGKSIDTVLQVKSPIEEIKTLGYWAGQAFLKLDEEVESGAPSGVLTGLTKFDEMTGGFKPGEVTLVGALPNVGKSQFVLNNIAVPAARAGYKVLFLSVEMHPRSIAHRAMVCAAEQTQNYHLKMTGLRNANWTRANAAAAGIVKPISEDLHAAVDDLFTLPFYLHQPKGLTPGQVLQYGRRQKRETGLDLIVIDYLQRMYADKPSNDLRKDMRSISQSIHEVAERLEVPIVGVASLNRAGAQRANKRPVKSDLAESSAFEYDADLVLYIHRPSEYDETQDYRDNELIIAKQRSGPLGLIPMRFMDERNVFKEAE